MKEKVSIGQLEAWALTAVRGQLGCHETQKVMICRYAEPDFRGRSWYLADIEPRVADPDASFRASQAIARLQDAFDIAA
jgi:hypothetical protein